MPRSLYRAPSELHVRNGRFCLKPMLTNLKKTQMKACRKIDMAIYFRHVDVRRLLRIYRSRLGRLENCS